MKITVAHIQLLPQLTKQKKFKNKNEPEWELVTSEPNPLPSKPLIFLRMKQEILTLSSWPTRLHRIWLGFTSRTPDRIASFWFLKLSFLPTLAPNSAMLVALVPLHRSDLSSQSLPPEAFLNIQTNQAPFAWFCSTLKIYCLELSIDIDCFILLDLGNMTILILNI